MPLFSIVPRSQIETHILLAPRTYKENAPVSGWLFVTAVTNACEMGQLVREYVAGRNRPAAVIGTGGTVIRATGLNFFGERVRRPQ